jgi:hypothetical protein
MSVGRAYEVLGLTPAAGRDLVHATYRRLALLHHPDRNPGDATSLGLFKELATAYRVLQTKFQLDDVDPTTGTGECDQCGTYGVVRTALDGSRVCEDCLSRGGVCRMLPAPPIVIASCTVTVVLLALAGLCLALGTASAARMYPMLALGLGVLALLSLAVTCMTIVYTADARHLSRHRHVRDSVISRAKQPAPSATRVNTVR